MQSATTLHQSWLFRPKISVRRASLPLLFNNQHPSALQLLYQILALETVKQILQLKFIFSES